MEIITYFDYDQLDTETRIVVKQRTLEIRAQIKHSAHAVADIGEKLIDVRSKLAEGRFDSWLKAEFDWTKMTAYRFIRVAEKFGSNNLLLDNAAPSALYLLASPSVSDETRQEAIGRAEAGETMTHKEAKGIVRKGGIPKTTITPQVADTAPVGITRQQSARRGRKDSVRVDGQATEEENYSQLVLDDSHPSEVKRVNGFTQEQVIEMLSQFEEFTICPFCEKPI